MTCYVFQFNKRQPISHRKRVSFQWWMWVTWSSTLAFFFLISFSTNSSEVTHFCLTANEGASRYRFCTGQHLWRDSTLSIYGKSLGAVPINSDDITAECTVTWPSLPQRCKISEGTEFSGKREKGKHCNCNFQPMDTTQRKTRKRSYPQHFLCQIAESADHQEQSTSSPNRAWLSHHLKQNKSRTIT